jgi:hypothetical protein
MDVGERNIVYILPENRLVTACFPHFQIAMMICFFFFIIVGGTTICFFVAKDDPTSEGHDPHQMHDTIKPVMATPAAL